LRILKNRWFAKFARKQDIANAALIDAIDRARSGLIDADLGGGIIKQRVAREGGGKSGGYRTIIAFRVDDLAVFLFGFAKNDRANLSAAELAEFREIGAAILKATATEIERAVAAKTFLEVKDDEGL
jgi:hypothetical protein